MIITYIWANCKGLKIERSNNELIQTSFKFLIHNERVL